MLNIKPATVFPTSDGLNHRTRAEAVAHEKGIIRKERIAEAINDGTLAMDEMQVSFSIGDVCQLIANNGEKLIELLTVKESRGPRVGNKKVKKANVVKVAAAPAPMN